MWWCMWKTQDVCSYKDNISCGKIQWLLQKPRSAWPCMHWVAWRRGYLWYREGQVAKNRWPSSLSSWWIRPFSGSTLFSALPVRGLFASIKPISQSRSATIAVRLCLPFLKVFLILTLETESDNYNIILPKIWAHAKNHVPLTYKGVGKANRKSMLKKMQLSIDWHIRIRGPTNAWKIFVKNKIL